MSGSSARVQVRAWKLRCIVQQESLQMGPTKCIGIECAAGLPVVSFVREGEGGGGTQWAEDAHPKGMFSTINDHNNDHN